MKKAIVGSKSFGGRPETYCTIHIVPLWPCQKTHSCPLPTCSFRCFHLRQTRAHITRQGNNHIAQHRHAHAPSPNKVTRAGAEDPAPRTSPVTIDILYGTISFSVSICLLSADVNVRADPLSQPLWRQRWIASADPLSNFESRVGILC